MPKAPRDKAKAAPKKNRKTAVSAVESVQAVPVEVVNGQNGKGAHGENGNGAVAQSAIKSPEVVEENNAYSGLDEQIRARAFELYMERGGHGGSPEQDWLRAKEEVSSRQRTA